MRFALAILLCSFALACGPASKHEILSRAEKIETKAELESALGDPDERHALGPVETWTYTASDGNVTFLITGDRVAVHATGE